MSVSAICQTVYQPSYPKSLDPALKSLCSKITRIFWNIISIIIFPIGLVRVAGWYLRHFAFKLVIPGPLHEKGTIQDFLKTHNAEKIDLKAPDGAKLESVLIPGKHKNKVILYAFGMADSILSSEYHINLFKPVDASIMMVNPRGVGNSSGWRSEQGYALDIYTAYEYLINIKGIDPGDIVLVGYSMGGAIGGCGAALIQKKYPVEISGVNIRSYANFQMVIDELFKGFTRSFISLFRPEIHAKNAWDKLKGDKCIFYCPSDGIVPKPASFYKAEKKNPVGNTKYVKMEAVEFPDLLSHARKYNEKEEQLLHDQLLHMLKLDRNQTSLGRHKKIDSPIKLKSVRRSVA